MQARPETLSGEVRSDKILFDMVTQLVLAKAVVAHLEHRTKQGFSWCVQVADHMHYSMLLGSLDTSIIGQWLNDRNEVPRNDGTQHVSNSIGPGSGLVHRYSQSWRVSHVSRSSTWI